MTRTEILNKDVEDLTHAISVVVQNYMEKRGTGIDHMIGIGFALGTELGKVAGAMASTQDHESVQYRLFASEQFISHTVSQASRVSRRIVLEDAKNGG